MSVRGRWGVALGLAALVGCTDPATQAGDGGMSGGDAWTLPGVPGTVEILPATMEGPGVPIDLLAMRIATVGMVGDRGPEFDPHIDGVGLVTLPATEYAIPIGDVPPALYSAVVLELADAPEESDLPVFELRLTIDGQPLDISTTEPLTLVARCEHGAVVNTTDAVAIGVDLALGLPVLHLTAVPLPEPAADGVVYVNETTAPEAIELFRNELAEHVHAECGPDTI